MTYKRTIIVKPTLAMDMPVEGDSYNAISRLKKMVENTIHNLEKVIVEPIFKFKQRKMSYQINMWTQDASHDLNALYTQLTKHKYIIR